MKFLSYLLPLLLFGCQPSLSRQPKNTALSHSDFFADGAAARPLPQGVVPFGAPAPVTVPLNSRTLQKGQQLFEIYCNVCHGPAGDGQSVAVARGFPKIPSLHEQGTREKSDAQLFDVIENGDGKMYGFGDRLPPEDISALVHYLRALQLSQSVPLAKLPAAEQARVKEIAP